jgi:hypothetical protein
MGETTMPDENPTQDQRYQFAVAMAMGQKVSVWAKKNGVPRRTCYDWIQTPEHKAVVREIRRRAFDRAIGHFARNVTKAADQIAILATHADSQSVQLQAARVLLRESLNVRDHVDLEDQLENIERRLDARDGKVA